VFVGDSARIGVEQSVGDFIDKGDGDLGEATAVSGVGLVLHGELYA
jgi:hypothetical protein